MVTWCIMLTEIFCCVFSETYSRIFKMYILSGENILISFSKAAIVPTPNKQDPRCSWTIELAKLSAHFAVCSMWNVCLTCGRKLHNLLGGGPYALRQYQLLCETFPIMLTQLLSLEVHRVNGRGLWGGMGEKRWPVGRESLSSQADQKWKGECCFSVNKIFLLPSYPRSTHHLGSACGWE